MKIHFKNRRNEKIVGILRIPDKKSSEITILVHGFLSSKDAGSKHVAEYLEKNHVNSLAIDLDDFGESEPKFEDMTTTKYADTIISAVHYCEHKDFKYINIIGTSSGGLSSMAAVLKYPKINSLILRSTSAFDAEWFKKYVGGAKGLIRWKDSGYIPYKDKRIKYDYYVDSLKYNMYKQAKDIKVPTLIIHGTKDFDIPLKSVLRLAKNFSKAKLLTIEGADHSLGVNGNYDKSQKIILEWMRKMRK